MNSTKETIFAAAIKAFSQKGYHKSTMDEIAEIAGVAKGTLYYHFKSKEEIFKFIIDQGFKVIKDEIKNKTQTLESPTEKLRAVCQVQIELVTKYLELFKTILSQMWGDEDRQSELRNVFIEYFEMIEEYIQEAMDKGLIPNGKAKEIAFNFFGMISSIVAFNLIHESSSIDEMTNNLLEFVMRGLGAKQ